jgi:hypothetical protein
LTSLLQAEVERLADIRQPHALAVFDVLNEWFHHRDFDCCWALNTLADGGDRAVSGEGMTPGDLALRRASGDLGPRSEALPDPRPSSEPSGELGLTRETLERYAAQAGSPNPREVGHQLQILMMGAILSAGRGDERAATHARSLAELLLDASRR